MRPRHRALGMLALALLLCGGAGMLLFDRESQPGTSETEADATTTAEEGPELIGAGPGSRIRERGATRPKSGQPKPRRAPPRRTYGIEGRVVRADDGPVGVVTVVARGPEGSASERKVSTNADGTFSFDELDEGRYRLHVAHGWITHRSGQAEVQAGTVVTLVLEQNPYVDLYFVDAETGHGLRVAQMEICEEVDGKRTLRRIPAETEVKKGSGKPWRFRFHNADPEHPLRMQIRTLGYEPSPWIDAPDQTATEPVYVRVRPDPEGVAKLVIDARTDSGEEIDWTAINVHKDGAKLTAYETVLENGRATLELLPGRYRFYFGMETVSSPTRPAEWFVPFHFDVEIARGQTITRSPVMVKGGFVKLREGDAITSIVFERAGEKLSLEPDELEDEEGTYVAVGPIPPGRWTYGYVDSEQRDRVGEVSVAAGRWASSTPKRVEDDADKDR